MSRVMKPADDYADIRENERKTHEGITNSNGNNRSLCIINNCPYNAKYNRDNYKNEPIEHHEPPIF